jgi:hypothetical protein
VFGVYASTSPHRSPWRVLCARLRWLFRSMNHNRDFLDDIYPFGPRDLFYYLR